MPIIAFFLACLAGAVLYRIGGSDLNIPMKTKFRDWGVPAVGVYALFQMLPMYSWAWHYLSLAGFFFASWGSLVTYWDHWGSDDVEWFEWVLTGFFYGLSALSIAIYTGRYVGFIIRTIILAIFIPFSNKFQFKVFWDKTDGVEGSRGFMVIATLPLLVV